MAHMCYIIFAYIVFIFTRKSKILLITVNFLTGFLITYAYRISNEFLTSDIWPRPILGVHMF